MSKVESQHLQRKTYVYVRQSTMAQVEHNVESRERQYEFTERAVSLGWDPAEVVVLDGDTARSARAPIAATSFSSWSPRSGSVGSGWCSGSRSRGSRGSTPTGTGCLICAR